LLGSITAHSMYSYNYLILHSKLFIFQLNDKLKLKHLGIYISITSTV
jgi:hypothetical protein